MKTKGLLPGICAALGMLVLIVDSEASLTAARDGVNLCIRTVIPSLFPFFVLSGILVREWTGRPNPLLRPLGQLLGMPVGSESLLITGFLGGYPVGAKAVRDSWYSGGLSEADANRLLTFCSNAGPAFLFGMAAPLFSNPLAGWILWLIQITSALMVGVVFRKPPDSGKAVPLSTPWNLSDALQSALSVTGQVCGWVISFRILTAFAQRWFLWMCPQWLGVFFTGFLEITNGCLSLSVVEGETRRFLLCSAMLSWGGVCVMMQTASVTAGLKLSRYLLGKLLQTGFSILICACFLGILSPVCLIFPVILSSCRRGKKISSIPHNAIV